MSDITQAILDEHDWFRRRFAELDGVTEAADLDVLWRLLAGKLEIHADAEEEIFYPELLRKGDDGTEETDDAIGDHDDIRDAVRKTLDVPAGSKEWWDAVGEARKANSEHMGEEERGALADFRRRVDPRRREDLGHRFTVRLAGRTRIDADLRRKGPDPKTYIADHS
ncbi:MAG: hemerythrin domain-containing protein [Acidimicrobiales bacterium]